MVELERERWNHNNHYHDLLLGQLGSGRLRVLDVGCGHGFFAAELARVADRVDAVDLDPSVVAEAATLHACARIQCYLLVWEKRRPLLAKSRYHAHEPDAPNGFSSNLKP